MCFRTGVPAERPFNAFSTGNPNNIPLTGLSLFWARNWKGIFPVNTLKSILGVASRLFPCCADPRRGETVPQPRKGGKKREGSRAKRGRGERSPRQGRSPTTLLLLLLVVGFEVCLLSRSLGNFSSLIETSSFLL